METVVNQSIRLPIDDQSQISEARRISQQLSRESDFSEEIEGKVSIIVSELATNLLKHAGGGDLLLQRVQAPGTSYCNLEIFSLDKGAGIADVSASMADGYSTAGSSGNGLGAISRLSTRFDIYSLPEKGTVIWSMVSGDQMQKAVPPKIEISGINVPVLREMVSGDAWSYILRDNTLWLCATDGLGHGPDAHQAAMTSMKTFRSSALRSPAETLEEIHGSLRATRGAAASIAKVDLDRDTLLFAGIGNVGGAIIAEPTRRLVTFNGTLGHNVRKFQENLYPLQQNFTLVLFSDGLISHWDIDAYPGILSKPVSILAALLYRDFARGRDDASVIVMRRYQATS